MKDEGGNSFVQSFQKKMWMWKRCLLFLSFLSSSSSLFPRNFSSSVDPIPIHFKDRFPLQDFSNEGRNKSSDTRMIVVRILPKSERQLLTLQRLEGSSSLDFWTSARAVNRPVDVRMARTFYDDHFKPWLLLLNSNEGGGGGGLIDLQIMIPDLERLIREEAEEMKRHEEETKNLLFYSQTNESLNRFYYFLEDEETENFFSSYHSLEEIFEFLNQIQGQEEAQRVGMSTFSIGSSYEARPLKVASLSAPSPPSSSGGGDKKKKGKGKGKGKKKKDDRKKKGTKKEDENKKRKKKQKKKTDEDIENERRLLRGKKSESDDEDEEDEEKKEKGGKKQKKPLIWIDCQFHAREWISAPTCLYLLLMLVKEGGSPKGSKEVKKWLETFDFHILPVSNPDGFEFSRTPGHRMWRKTRSKRQNKCFGVDPNRNWSFKWGTGGSSDDPCDETYKGPHPFSEPMTAAIRDHLLAESESRPSIPLYLSIHSYSQFIIIPWSYSKKLPPNYMSMLDKATATARAIGHFSGTEYFVGQSVRTMYIASGTSDDWALAVAGARNSYTMEVRDTGKHGFMLPANQILANGREVWAGLRIMFDKLWIENQEELLLKGDEKDDPKKEKKKNVEKRKKKKGSGGQKRKKGGQQQKKQKKEGN